MNTRKQMYRITRRGGRARVVAQSHPRPWTLNALALMAAAAALLLLLSACAPAATQTPAATPPPMATEAPPSEAAPATPAGVGESSEPASIDDLIAALLAADGNVQAGDPVDEPFFGHRAVHVNVNGEDIQVFEFASEAEQAAAAATITANGYIVGNAAVDWISQPYFFAQGNVIALYVGTNPATVQHLTTVLGPALTGPQ